MRRYVRRAFNSFSYIKAQTTHNLRIFFNSNPYQSTSHTQAQLEPMPIMIHAITALAALASLTQGASLAQRAEPDCTDFLIPVTASSNKQIPANNIPSNLNDSTVLTDYLVSQLSSGLAGVLGATGNVEQGGSFQMSARYCKPAVTVASRANTIQYLQHAITMNKDYWNGLTYPVGVDGDMYNYAKVASDVSVPQPVPIVTRLSACPTNTPIQNGYPTIAIDNLGHGNSSKPDPVAVVQMGLQTEIAATIIEMLRNGTVEGPVAGKKFSKVIVGLHDCGYTAGS